jgi:hypothetical protein
MPVSRISSVLILRRGLNRSQGAVKGRRKVTGKVSNEARSSIRRC